MRLALLPCLASLLLLDATLAAPLGHTGALGADAGVRAKRGNIDGFDFLDGLDHTTGQGATYHFSTDALAHPTGGAGTTSATATGSITSAPTDTLPTSAGKKKPKESEFVPTGTSYSVIGTIPPLETQSISALNGHPQPSAPTAASPSASAQAANAASSGSGSGGTSEWKIIGVAVIAFSAVAAILLLSVFFDHWSRFVKDLCGGRSRRRRGANAEQLVPDWEKAEWELRFEDRQRYPSFTSLPSVPLVHPSGSGDQTQIQPPSQAAAGRSGREAPVQGRGPARHLEGRLDARSPASSRVSRVESNGGYAGVGLVGLGLGRMAGGGGCSRNGEAVSPRAAGRTGKSPTPQVGYTKANANVQRGKNPFEDPHSPMPDDVYGGMAN